MYTHMHVCVYASGQSGSVCVLCACVDDFFSWLCALTGSHSSLSLSPSLSLSLSFSFSSLALALSLSLSLSFSSPSLFSLPHSVPCCAYTRVYTYIYHRHTRKCFSTGLSALQQYTQHYIYALSSWEARVYIHMHHKHRRNYHSSDLSPLQTTRIQISKNSKDSSPLQKYTQHPDSSNKDTYGGKHPKNPKTDKIGHTVTLHTRSGTLTNTARKHRL